MRRLKTVIAGSYQTENTAFVPYDRTLLFISISGCRLCYGDIGSMPVGQRLAERSFHLRNVMVSISLSHFVCVR